MKTNESRKRGREIRKNRNYFWFYRSFNMLTGIDDPDEMKCNLVLTYTGGRTTHLREMTDEEYATLCRALEEECGYRSQVKRHRSHVLHLMQIYGVDTTTWDNVDRFCLDRRIAGKHFRYLTVKELQALSRKLMAMTHKKQQQEPPRQALARPTPQNPPTADRQPDEIIYIDTSNIGLS